MDRSLAIGATGGSISALLWQVASDLFQESTGLECPVCPVPLECISEIGWERLDWPSVAFGVLLGFFLGPIFDLLYVIREGWRLWVRERLGALVGGNNRPLYRLA